ncbi:MAG TPA: hypothetical protein PK530_06080 [Anaerolineales bacterium]|nr:hypothetical protein [Anaerolineales bacterium]
MNAIEQMRDRFMQDDLPTRLGGLAADLMRVASSARRPTGAKAVERMLEESQYFIEWTAAELEPEKAFALVNMQRLIALWRAAWPQAQKDQIQRTILSVTAKQWADEVMGYSGLIQ